MRIRLFAAFASNNSGAFTIVGRFADADAAAGVARLLQGVADEHSAWHEANPYEEQGAAPLDAFARARGLREGRHGRGDEWPQHGAAPTVLAVDRQVVVHAPYTVSLPPVFGEAFYAMGGRVEAELDHTHERLAVEFSWYRADLNYGDPRIGPALDDFEAKLRPVLAGVLAPGETDRRPAIAPAWHRDGFGQRHVSAVFVDLVEGVRAVRAVADACAMKLSLRITECPHGVADPFAMLRLPTRSRGPYRVILWSAGPERVWAMRALREVMACGLDEARATIDALPTECLVDVTEAEAERAVTALSGAGCDAEVVAPRR
jgi:ribosomal protein L7/L12